MDKFVKILGKEIRDRRTERGMKQSELVAKYEIASGRQLTCSQLSQWENGKSMMSVEQFHFICVALECSPSTIMPYKDDVDKREMIKNEIGLLSKELVDIFHYAITEWYGNSKALWKFVGLYIALPNKFRQTIAEIGCGLYRACKDTRQLSSKAPTVDIAYLEQETRRLW